MRTRVSLSHSQALLSAEAVHLSSAELVTSQAGQHARSPLLTRPCTRRWGLGGHRACVLVEDVEARAFGAWPDWAGLESLRAALDRRGEREGGLLAELGKVRQVEAVDPGSSLWPCTARVGGLRRSRSNL